MKARLVGSLKKKCESKEMHSQYIGSMATQLICEEDTFLWLLRGDLKGETGSEIIAAQDQELQTRYHAIKMLQAETLSICRLCENLMRQCYIYQHAQFWQKNNIDIIERVLN
jgi:hypothetical protein